MKKTLLSICLIAFISMHAFSTGDQEQAPAPAGDSPVGTEEQFSGETVKFWGGGFSEDQELWNIFYEETGIKVDFGVQWVETSKLLAAVASGNPPDALFMNMGEVVELAARNAIHPYEDFISGEGMDVSFEDFFPQSLKLGEYNGQFYALPWDLEARILYWNKDLFEEAGLDPERPPRTWNELLEYSEKLTKYNSSGEIEQVGLISSNINDLRCWILQNNGSFLSTDGLKSTCKTPEVIEALEFAMKIPAVYGGDDKLTEGVKFEIRSGNVAMAIDSAVWAYGDFISNYQDLNLGISVPPGPTEDTKVTSGSATWALILPKKSANPQYGALLASWLATRGILYDEIQSFENDPDKFGGRPLANIQAHETMMNEYIPASPNSYVKEMYRKRAEIYENYAVFPSSSAISGSVGRKQEMYWAQVYNGDMTIQDMLDQLDNVQKSVIAEYLSSK